MVLDPIPQSLPVHFFGSQPQPPTSRRELLCTANGKQDWCISIGVNCACSICIIINDAHHWKLLCTTNRKQDWCISIILNCACRIYTYILIHTYIDDALHQELPCTANSKWNWCTFIIVNCACSVYLIIHDAHSQEHQCTANGQQDGCLCILMQKRPTLDAKETYIRRKRDLI